MKSPGLRDVFTTAEIGAATGKSQQAIRRAFNGSHPSGKKFTANNLADAWAVSDMPAAIVAELRGIQKHRHYRTLTDVLTNPPKPWAPPVPLARVSDADLRKAHQLQQALARALTLPEETRSQNGRASPAKTSPPHAATA